MDNSKYTRSGLGSFLEELAEIPNRKPGKGQLENLFRLKVKEEYTIDTSISELESTHFSQLLISMVMSICEIF